MPAVSVEVSPAEHTYYTIGDERQLSATARDASHEPVPGQTITWESSDTAVVGVSPAEHDLLLESIRGEQRFKGLMVRERVVRVCSRELI
ncbi:MAG: Ig-like domain-containing protein [Gemmatimonadota bacterium]|nr:MAG: Ig-like domain-containing protein [Gemmatimonadota bacterium]